MTIETDTILRPLASSPTPANSAKSSSTAHRRPGTRAFAERLAAERALTDPQEIADAKARREEESSAYEKAREFVSQALVYPFLKESRESNNAWGPFAPGKHEKAFSWLIDERVAQNIVSAKNFPLVDRVAEILLDTPERLPVAPPELPTALTDSKQTETTDDQPEPDERPDLGAQARDAGRDRARAELARGPVRAPLHGTARLY